MFDWFNKAFTRHKYPEHDHVPDINKVGEDMNKVIPFPELKAAPPPPKEDSAGKTYYSIGLTDNSRVSLSVGYSSVTMNALGVQHLIDQLALFKSQIEESTDD